MFSVSQSDLAHSKRGSMLTHLWIYGSGLHIQYNMHLGTQRVNHSQTYIEIRAEMIIEHLSS